MPRMLLLQLEHVLHIMLFVFVSVYGSVLMHCCVYYYLYFAVYSQ